jgi:hypothetical protein
VPLSRIQTEVLRLLASRRDEPSPHIDIFHDREKRVARAAEEDATLLQENGYTLEWLRREPAIYAVVITRAGEATKLEWVVDSDFRFFPTMPDATFGYLLHPIDLATNKVAAAYGRREPRDVVDLLTIHDRILPLGAVVWASAGKALGFTPEGIVNEIRRVAGYTDEDFRRVASDPPFDPAATMTRLREVLSEAEAFVTQMPTDKAGLLFLQDSRVVQPDPGRLTDYQTHAGQRQGHWPSSPEISAAMFERYQRPASP